MTKIIRDGYHRGWMVQFTQPEGKPAVIRLGTVLKHQAEEMRGVIEGIVTSYEAETAADGRDSITLESGREDIERARLAEINTPMTTPTLSQWLDWYLRSRTDIQPQSKLHYEAAGRELIRFFGGSARIDHISSLDAETFRTWMKTVRGLAEVTVSMNCRRAKQFFRAAVNQEALAENPFEDIPCTAVANPRRLYFVTREEAKAVLEVIPNAEWRLVFALCRYGGLRCRSEATKLKWENIDWARSRLTVHGTKVQRHDGGVRQVPIFPELLPYLQAVYQQAKDPEYVFTGSRRSGKNPSSYLRYQVIRAGLKPWPRITQNLRSTRETELADDYPLHVVAAWMGHSRRVATKHYLQITESHYERAAKETRPCPSTSQLAANLPDGLTRCWAKLPEHAKTAILDLVSATPIPATEKR